ncbi:hypothetical protein WP2S18C03_00310 [Aeromonas veronii]|nr:hypothetical protein WP2S18C03_00310 [Aeromonas veronii]
MLLSDRHGCYYVIGMNVIERSPCVGICTRNSNELMLAPCDGHAQWVWQEDKLFNSKVSRCLDVAGRRHSPNTPLRLADCYGGANQSFLVGGIE